MSTVLQQESISSVSMALSCSDSVVRLGLAITDFALALLPHLSEDDGADNVFFSPLSLVSALAMTRLGARQATASQIHAALRLTRILESDVHSAFGEINALLNTTGANTYLLKIANRLFANMDYTFLEEYLSMTRQHYDAEAQALDFAGDSEGSRVTINDWIEEQTAGKIRDLLPPDSINSLTAMVLTNAIYFKGDWKEQFDHRDTHPEPFHLTPDDTIEVDMMHKEDTYHVGFSEELDCKSVELPYKGGDLSMVLIIPNKLCGLKEVERRINANNIKPLIICPDKMKVMVSLPKFKLEFESQLKSKLQSLGMTDAFEYGKADFSGMDGTQQLYISEVIHKAFIEVNEEGTEAAAATAVVMFAYCMPPQFTANQPFLFVIRDRRAGAILFMGRVAKPAMVIHKAYIEVNEEGTEAAAATGVQIRLMCMPPQFRANQPFLFVIRDRRSGAVLFMGRVAKPKMAS